MPKSEASRPSKATRTTTTTTDFSAVIRHAHRQHLQGRPYGKPAPVRNHSTLGTQTIGTSFRESLTLVSRLPVASRPRFVVKGAARQPLPRIEPRFRPLTLFVIVARIFMLFWIGARLTALTLNGATRAFGSLLAHQGRLWLARRPASEAVPMSAGMDSSEALMQV